MLPEPADPLARCLHRLSRALSPRADRLWVDALFAELAAIRGAGARGRWALGAFGLLTSRYLERSGQLFWHQLRLAIPLSLVATCLAVFEDLYAHSGDFDEFCDALAWGFGSVCTLLVAAVATRYVVRALDDLNRPLGPG